MSEVVGSYRFRQIKVGDIIGCSVQVLDNGMPSPGNLKRAHYFFKTGMVLSTVDSPFGNSTSATGSRVHYILPASGSPKLNIEKEANQAKIEDASGLQWRIGGAGAIQSSSGCQVNFKNTVRWEDEGGLEIESCPGKYVIDAGFARGNYPTRYKDRTSVIIGPTGSMCKIKNADLYLYSGREVSGVRYSTKEALRTVTGDASLCAPIRGGAPSSEPLSDSSIVPGAK